ncbi:hypothetical protein LPTSP4_19510 [Leptospira ryugenii]|uniref:Lipoprotein n=1 Tax=Leptospira ryugenii TaxID=1917863 RepID=A0A2P2E0U5_9LEPT|nr:hypothetical protein [Leptospira ryugenii]GBF50426.1 hypothetical protein LPTSP4_19510 [Leptospira ryugenii]
MKNLRLGAFLIIAFSLVFNCSTTAKRVGDYQAPNYQVIKLSDKITLKYLPEAETEIKGGDVFKEEVFLNLFKSKLKDKGVFSEKAKETIEIQINDARFRSAGVAIWVGTFAGADSIDIDLTIKDAKGNIIDQHKIKVSYALGGFGGGPNSVRSEYFYNKIINLTLQQLGYPTD